MTGTSVDISFLYNYKGVLYPIDFDKKWSRDQAQTNTVRSLVELSAGKIVLDAGSTKRALQAVPQDLCYSLMKAALLLARDRAIEVLIAHWPWPVLTLRKFAPPLFEDIGALYNEDYISDRMRRGVKYTTCLAHTFVECLKKRASTKLQCLDLTGYPAAEVIVNYLSSHVLLVYNETRQREIINMYNEVTQDLPQEQRQQYTLQTTLPDHTFVIHVDAFLQTNDTHMELCRALKTAKMEHCHFRLDVHRLDLTCLGVARISVLLEQINPQILTGLSLQYNGLNCPGLVILGPSLKQLTQLTALDLSCNNINLAGDEKVCDIMEKTLQSLGHLTRLDLSNNRTKGRLRKILSSVPQPLHYLRLAGCGLSAADLAYLERSHHTAALQELDISDNRLTGPGRTFERVTCLLGRLIQTLVVLEMEDTELEDTDLIDMFRAVTCLIKLRFWNISKLHQLSESVIMEHMSHLVAMDSLQVVRLSFPTEVYVSIDEQEVEEEKEAFSHRLTHLVNRMCERQARTPIAIAYTT